MFSGRVGNNRFTFPFCFNIAHSFRTVNSQFHRNSFSRCPTALFLWTPCSQSELTIHPDHGIKNINFLSSTVFRLTPTGCDKAQINKIKKITFKPLQNLLYWFMVYWVVHWCQTVMLHRKWFLFICTRVSSAARVSRSTLIGKHQRAHKCLLPNVINSATDCSFKVDLPLASA